MIKSKYIEGDTLRLQVVEACVEYVLYVETTQEIVFIHFVISTVQSVRMCL